MTRNEKPVALEAWEALAENYAARADTQFENVHIERPATLSLLPDVSGKRVLDVGCGPGWYSEWLIVHGAEVVAVDFSTKMVEMARKRLPESVEVHLRDVGKPLDFLSEGSFDLVLAPLVIDCVEDWNRLFFEFNRLLSNHGVLVISVCHPFTEYLLRSKGSYFEIELIEAEWKSFGPSVTMPSYRRPLSAMLSSITDAGFNVEKLLEPAPVPESRQIDPDSYEEYLKKPAFLCIRARKISG
jgi:2-polyprenyl-3-methyl-5-hydroxy-6-metoxy-1,4-benzoquinol methylase